MVRLTDEEVEQLRAGYGAVEDALQPGPVNWERVCSLIGGLAVFAANPRPVDAMREDPGLALGERPPE